MAKALLLSTVAMLLPQTSMAGSLTSRAMSTDKHTKSATTASYDMSFVMASNLTNGQTVTVTWPAGFDISAVTSSDVDVENVTDTVDYTVAASAANGQWGFGVSGQVMTLTAPSDISSVNTLVANETMHIEIGPNATMGAASATNGITNPSTAGSYSISVGGTMADTGGFAIAIVDDSRIAVTATVQEKITMALSDTSIDFGTMATGAHSKDSHTVQIDTNADTGYKLKYKASVLTNENGTTLSTLNSDGAANGTEGWGINLKSNTTPSIGAEKTATTGTGTASSGYSTADVYKVDTTGSHREMAGSSGVAEAEVYTVTYVANISATTPAGTYTGTLELLGHGTF